MKNAEVLAALADPTRMKMVGLLLQKNYCAGALAALLGVSAPAVSQQMKVLQDAGLVEGEKRGCHVHYAVCRQRLRDLADELAAMAGEQASPCERQGGRCGEAGMHACCKNARCAAAGPRPCGRPVCVRPDCR